MFPSGDGPARAAGLASAASARPFSRKGPGPKGAKGGYPPLHSPRCHSVKKMCRWHIFSVGRSGYAARRELGVPGNDRSRFYSATCARRNLSEASLWGGFLKSCRARRPSGLRALFIAEGGLRNSPGSAGRCAPPPGVAPPGKEISPHRAGGGKTPCARAARRDRRQSPEDSPPH